MEKNKYPHTDPNNQVHSEFETSDGNNFNTVIRETQAKNDPDNKEEPLNLPDRHEYEWDRAEEPAKMNMGHKVDKMPMLIGLAGIVGLVVAIGVVRSLRVKPVNQLIC